MTTAPVVDSQNSFQVPGPVHTKDFTLVFCSNPDCSNMCEVEGTNVCSTTTFICRTCNPPGSGFPAGLPCWYQFEKNFRQGIPDGTDHIDRQGSDVINSEDLESESPDSTYAENFGSDASFLRRYFDAKDLMITSQRLKKRLIERPCPGWMLDETEVQTFLQTR